MNAYRYTAIATWPDGRELRTKRNVLYATDVIHATSSAAGKLEVAHYAMGALGAAYPPLEEATIVVDVQAAGDA